MISSRNSQCKRFFLRQPRSTTMQILYPEKCQKGFGKKWKKKTCEKKQTQMETCFRTNSLNFEGLESDVTLNPKCNYWRLLLPAFTMRNSPETFQGEQEFTLVATAAGDNLAKQSYLGKQKGGKQKFSSLFCCFLENSSRVFF